MSCVRIVHYDDSAAYRLLLAERLRAYDGVAVVVSTGSREEIVAAAAATAPDVVLLDGGLDPAATGLVAQLRAVAPSARLIGLSGAPAAASVGLAEAADGYVGKDAPLDELVAALRA